mmetsp:Transcript_14195/g.30748  ORF Transcript_14195/g.30748 Transcript_14195/m.30748 type:complete len:231 (-) Transcript_14195:60-752(-)
MCEVQNSPPTCSPGASGGPFTSAICSSCSSPQTPASKPRRHHPGREAAQSCAVLAATSRCGSTVVFAAVVTQFQSLRRSARLCRYGRYRMPPKTSLSTLRRTCATALASSSRAMRSAWTSSTPVPAVAAGTWPSSRSSNSKASWVAWSTANIGQRLVRSQAQSVCSSVSRAPLSPWDIWMAHWSRGHRTNSSEKSATSLSRERTAHSRSSPWSDSIPTQALFSMWLQANL